MWLYCIHNEKTYSRSNYTSWAKNKSPKTPKSGSIQIRTISKQICLKSDLVGVRLCFLPFDSSCCSTVHWISMPTNYSRLGAHLGVLCPRRSEAAGSVEWIHKACFKSHQRGRNSSVATPRFFFFFPSLVLCTMKIQKWSLPSHPPPVLSLGAIESFGLTEMEGLLFDSAPGGLLMVSKWSPPATALIIRDPGCMSEDRRGGGPDQELCSWECLCASSQERRKKRRKNSTWRDKMKNLLSHFSASVYQINFLHFT